jgi:cytochrome P450
MFNDQRVFPQKEKEPGPESKRLPPGPRGYPLVGMVPKLVQDPLKSFSDAAQQYGDVVKMDIGPTNIFLLRHPDHVHQVLREKSANYVRGGGAWETLGLLFGNGLAVSEGEFWKRQRRLMQPQFHQKRLARTVPAMRSTIERELALWQDRADGAQRLDLVDEMKHLTMSVFLTAMFGTDITPEDAKLAGESISQSLSYVQARMLFHWLPSWMPLPGARKFHRAMRSLDRIVRGMIASHGDGSGADDLLSLLMTARSEDGEVMSHDQVRDEIFTFFIAGYETTATAMMWTFYLLCQHPEVERRLRAEVNEVLGGRDPSYEDVAKLRYTSLVIHEAMRIYPPVWIIMRQSLEDDKIGKYFLPAGSLLVVLPHIVHRHPDFWSDPEVFKPERFAEMPVAQRHRRAYMPFGLGPHQCIGNHFALIEATLILAMAAQRYKMKLVPGFKVETKLVDTIRPVGGLPVTLERVH